MVAFDTQVNASLTASSLHRDKPVSHRPNNICSDLLVLMRLLEYVSTNTSHRTSVPAALSQFGHASISSGSSWLFSSGGDSPHDDRRQVHAHFRCRWPLLQMQSRLGQFDPIIISCACPVRRRPRPCVSAARSTSSWPASPPGTGWGCMICHQECSGLPLGYPYASRKTETAEPGVECVSDSAPPSLYQPSYYMIGVSFLGGVIAVATAWRSDDSLPHSRVHIAFKQSSERAGRRTPIAEAVCALCVQAVSIFPRAVEQCATSQCMCADLGLLESDMCCDRLSVRSRRPAVNRFTQVLLLHS